MLQWVTSNRQRSSMQVQSSTRTAFSWCRGVEAEGSAGKEVDLMSSCACYGHADVQMLLFPGCRSVLCLLQMINLFAPAL